GDELQIAQALKALLENAIKFSKTHSPNLIEVSASRQGEMLKICISDQGIGIDNKDLEIIFEDFRQGGAEKTRLYGGSGLGLTISKKVVETHGGKIWVESKRGNGTQFFLTLPLNPALIVLGELDAVRKNPMISLP